MTRHRRVVAMSPRDRERAAAGEDVFAPRVEPGYLGDEARPVTDGDPTDGAAGAGAAAGIGARDAELLREVPPHWHGGAGS